MCLFIADSEASVCQQECDGETVGIWVSLGVEGRGTRELRRKNGMMRHIQRVENLQSMGSAVMRAVMA